MAERTRQNRLKFGIVTPLANEEATLLRYCQTLIAELSKLEIDYAVYFVIDKASQDQTLILARNLEKQHSHLKVIYSKDGKNVVDAYLCGFKQALHDQCDYIVEMDAGFSHNPQEILLFVEKLREGFDCVFGVRPLWSSAYPVPFKRRFYSLAGTVLANLFLGTNLSDMTSGFEAFSASALKKLTHTPLLSTGHFYQTEIRFRARKMKIATVLISYQFPSNSVNSKSVKNALSSFWHYLLRRNT